METCAAAVARHTLDVDYDLMIVTRDAAFGELDHVVAELPLRQAGVFFANVPDVSGSLVHGRMLDVAMDRIMAERRSPFVLTLDSDCFPVADGWLSGLLGEFDDPKVGAAGILHPWGPPPEDMDHHLIEWRVRSQHCWESTHVACQLVRTGMLEGSGVRFSSGDDTGLDVVRWIKSAGMVCAGYRPTRCPVSRTGFDPEFNRYVGVVYGDKVYHHGAYTRTEIGCESPVLPKSMGWALDRVLLLGGAEWLLDDSVSHRYVFDREEEVAAEKMDRLFGLKKERKEE
jgi:hypothetical protein